MAMDFFEHQDVARKQSGRLVVLFMLAVLSIIALTYAVVAGVLAHTAEVDFWNPLLLLAVTTGTVALVAGGSLYKVSQLAGGGSAVAESLGGQPILRETADADEAMLLNVVEEMAIAAGTPVPPVYVIDEDGINAFAAGYGPEDAVVGVTRGCMRRLTRDELQGVIAHEFSHILNGDMRLNIRLIGVLHGILIIGIIGYGVTRMLAYGGGRSSRRRGKDEGGAIVAILAIGVGLMIVGFMGTFFGNWIKAAVSRQREFLADASAVQFTRNPRGIGGALQQIGAGSAGAAVNHPQAPEISHMFFAQALTSGMASLMATHPPLPERIRRVMPDWDGEFPSAREPRPERGAPAVEAADMDAEDQRLLEGVMAAGTAAAAGAVMPKMMEQAGRPTAQHLSYAKKLLKDLPPALYKAAHDPYGARALVYALVLDRDADVKEKQFDRLAVHADEGVCKLTHQLLAEVQALRVEARLPLLDLATAAMRSMSNAQYETFKQNLEALISADGRVTFFEWALRRILLTHLDAHFGNAKPPRTRHGDLSAVAPSCRALLSALAQVGHADDGAAEKAYRAGADRIGLKAGPADRSALNLMQLDRALDELNAVAPQAKKKLLEACAACVAADKQVTPNEAELFRATAESLGCPMPPLLPGQSLD